MKNKKILGVGLFIVLLAALMAVFFLFREKPVAGSKEITIEVINEAQESTLYELKTDAEYFQQAIEETEGLEVTGTEGQYGLMVDTVNGEFAEFNTNGAYWGFYVNGEYCNYGIGEQPVNDGDAFQIVFSK